MDLASYVASVEDSLLAAAAAGDERTLQTAAALAAALEPAVRLALMNALADVASEVGEALGDRSVEMRLDAGDVRVVVSSAPLDERLSEPVAAPFADGGEPSRITLRLPEALKLEAERAAAAEALSLNTWLTRAVQHALGGGQPGKARVPERHGRVRGWVQG